MSTQQQLHGQLRDAIADVVVRHLGSIDKPHVVQGVITTAIEACNGCAAMWENQALHFADVLGGFHVGSSVFASATATAAAATPVTDMWRSLVDEAMRLFVRLRQHELGAVSDRISLLHSASRDNRGLTTEEVLKATNEKCRLEAESVHLVGEFLVASFTIAFGVSALPHRMFLEVVGLLREVVEKHAQFPLRGSPERDGSAVDYDWSACTIVGNPVAFRARWNVHDAVVSSVALSPLLHSLACCLEHGSRWPCLLDPSGDLERWLRSLERSTVVDFTSANETLRLVHVAARQGAVVVLRGVPDTTCASFFAALPSRQGASSLFQLPDQHPSFRLVVCGKRPESSEAMAAEGAPHPTSVHDLFHTAPPAWATHERFTLVGRGCISQRDHAIARSQRALGALAGVLLPEREEARWQATEHALAQGLRSADEAQTRMYGCCHLPPQEQQGAVAAMRNERDFQLRVCGGLNARRERLQAHRRYYVAAAEVTVQLHELVQAVYGPGLLYSFAQHLDEFAVAAVKTHLARKAAGPATTSAQVSNASASKTAQQLRPDSADISRWRTLNRTATATTPIKGANEVRHDQQHQGEGEEEEELDDASHIPLSPAHEINVVCLALLQALVVDGSTNASVTSGLVARATLPRPLDHFRLLRTCWQQYHHGTMSIEFAMQLVSEVHFRFPQKFKPFEVKPDTELQMGEQCQRKVSLLDSISSTLMSPPSSENVRAILQQQGQEQFASPLHELLKEYAEWRALCEQALCRSAALEQDVEALIAHLLFLMHPTNAERAEIVDPAAFRHFAESILDALEHCRAAYAAHRLIVAEHEHEFIDAFRIARQLWETQVEAQLKDVMMLAQADERYCLSIVPVVEQLQATHGLLDGFARSVATGASAASSVCAMDTGKFSLLCDLTIPGAQVDEGLQQRRHHGAPAANSVSVYVRESNPQEASRVHRENFSILNK